ncbi:MAG: sigma-70 family RNA polymerase sigma factor [Candidatus Hydrogenedentes bacterium]|nr:sigma-70 family RNA polymerase sigma factor [Candidatus Hydrogenedentota bacterium]
MPWGPSERDESIVARVLAGQHDQFGALVERYLPVVQAIARARIPNPADVDDIAQESFVLAFQRLDQLRERKKFGAWLGTIARNVAHGVQRRRQQDAALAASLPDEESIEPDLIAWEARRAVREQIDALTPKDREVLLLKYYADKSSQEIAAILSMSDAAVRKRLQRAREALGERVVHAFREETAAPADRERHAQRILGAALAAGATWNAATAAAATSGIGSPLAVSVSAGKAMAVGAALCIGIAILVVVNQSPSAREDNKVVEEQTQGSTMSQVVDTSAIASTDTGEDVSATSSKSPVSPGGILVSGRILHTDGTPIAGATVRGRYGRHEPSLPDLETVSGDDGAYTLRAIMPWERFSVRAEKEGYVQFEPTIRSITEEGASEVDHTLYREATIEGVVVNPQGSGVPGMPVTAVNQDREPMLWAKTSQTNASGVFRLEGLLPGRHHLAVIKEEDYSRGVEALEVELQEGEHRTGIRVPYDGEGLVIAGRVTNEKGEPMAGAFVGVANGLRPRHTYTDENGFYRFTQLPPGTFPVGASFDGYEDIDGLLHDERLIASGTEGVDIVLRRKGSVTGQVVDADTGEPIPVFGIMQFGGTASSLDSESERSMRTIKNKDGQFTMKNVGLDEATIAIKADGYMPAFEVVHLTSGEHVEGITLELHRGGTLNGLVVAESGNPIGGAGVFVGSLPWPGGGNAGTHGARVVTDDGGAFTLTDLLPGQLRISCAHSDYAPGSIETIVPQPAGSSPVRLVLKRPGDVEGTVSVGGVPQDGASVMAFYAHSETNRDGTFRLSHLPVDGVEITAALPAAGMPGYFGRRMNKWVMLEPGQTMQVDFDFATNTGIVEGEIVPPGEFEFYAQVWCSIPAPDGIEERILILEERRFTLNDMPAGVVEGRVALAPKDDDSVAGPTPDYSRPFRATVVPGETVPLTVTFSGASVITGHVAGMSHEGKIRISLFEGSQPLPDDPEQSITRQRGGSNLGANGDYRVDCLEAGTYTVIAKRYIGPSAVVREVSEVLTIGDGETVTLNFDLR